MKCSIIICFYERIDYLRCCLDSLKICAGDFEEVVVADDGSSEAVVHKLNGLIGDYPFPIVHACLPRQGARRAACRNHGIRKATGDYLIFMDADFLVLPGAIRSHREAAAPGQYVAGRCKYLTEPQSQRVFSEPISALLLEDLYRQLPDRPVIRDHREFVRYGILHRLGLASARRQTFGGHYSVYRRDIERVNGYDENFIGWGGEDLDIALRMNMAGLKGRSAILTARMLHVWHPKELGGSHWKEGPNIAYFNRKNIPCYCENGLTKPPLCDARFSTSSQRGAILKISPRFSRTSCFFKPST
jgi:glycosyltransferase involved in cell wall biosynthesis